ncbi:retrovirus-related pol polyprotein from transposon TNT 1-94 [Tanacetum coccineum]
MGYGDYQIGNVTISRVYYVEGLWHNLFSVRQFCIPYLRSLLSSTHLYIRNLEGVDLLTGSRRDNLYTLSLRDMMTSSPICLLLKASKTKSWLWHRRLSHLNFSAINHLAIHGLVRGLPKLKFEKDHLCSACALGKSTKKPHKPKSEDTNQEKLYLLRMDLCGPMRVASVNEKKYILVIVNDYSQFTWVKCLRSKDEAPAFIINFLKMIQTLREYYEKVGISHETSVARSPQQNGVIERQNCTLIEAARTMLIYAKAPLFLWAKAVAIACYTQNYSMIRRRHGKTPYELLHNKPPDLSYVPFGYAPTKKAFRIYNRRTRRIIKTIHVDFDELTAMASEHSSSGPALHEMTHATISLGLMANPHPSTPVDHPAPEVVALINELIALVLADSTGLPSSTIVDQDAPSPSNSQTTPETDTPVISNDVEEDNHDIEVEHMISQSPRGIFINQSKYALESLKKYGFDSCNPVDTPMVEKSKLDEDKEKKAVDPSHYHAFANADNAGCQDTRHNTSDSMQLLGDRLVSWSSKRQKSAAISSMEAEYIALSGCYIFTKALGRNRIEFLINKLGMRSFTPETLKQLADEVDE